MRQDDLLDAFTLQSEDNLSISIKSRQAEREVEVWKACKT